MSRLMLAAKEGFFESLLLALMIPAAIFGAIRKIARSYLAH